MSQLTFGDAFKEKKKVENTSWYNGRVLSHSSISTYQQCPQKWKFRYVDKIPEKPRPYFSFGKSVHNGLEFLFSKLGQRPPTIEDVLENYREQWISEGYESSPQEKWFFDEGDRILRGFYNKHKDDHKKVVKVELKFNIEVSGVPLVGYIDRIDETASGQLAIIDYKTGKAFDKSRVRKDPQLTLYQIACEMSLGKKVESVTLYHLNSLTPITVSPHSKPMESDLRTKIVESARGISDQKYDPIPEPNGYCKWCDYVQICPAFSNKSIQKALSEDVDRYGKLELRIRELEKEKNKLASSLKSHLDATGTKEMTGEHYKINRYPSSTNRDDSLQVLLIEKKV